MDHGQAEVVAFLVQCSEDSVESSLVGQLWLGEEGQNRQGCCCRGVLLVL